MLASKGYKGFERSRATGILWVGTLSLWVLLLVCFTGCVSYPEYPTPAMTEQFRQENAQNAQQQYQFQEPAQNQDNRVAFNNGSSNSSADQPPLYSQQQTPSQTTQRHPQSYYSQQPRTPQAQTNQLTNPINKNPAGDLQPRVYYLYDPSNPNADDRGLVRVTDDRGYKPPQQTNQNPNQWQQPPTAQQQPNSWNNQQNQNNLARNNLPGVQKPALAVVSGVSVAEERPAYSSNPTTIPYDHTAAQPAPTASAPSSQGISSMANSTGTTGQSSLPVVNVHTAPPAITTNQNLTQPAVSQQPQTAKLDFSSANTEDAIKYLERLIDTHPENVNYQMALRLLYSAYGDSDKALRQLPGMSTETQSDALTLAQAVVLASQFQVDKNNPVSANRALEALRQLTNEVAEKADLNISSLKICKSNSVQGFGLYEVFPKQYLETGSPCKILVYCELQNFKSKLNAQGKYITSLHADITLYDAGFTPLVKLSRDVEDVPSFNQRHDFFLRGPIDIPQLAPGKYEIVVSIEDKVAGKKALPRRYEFQVKANTK